MFFGIVHLSCFGSLVVLPALAPQSGVKDQYYSAVHCITSNSNCEAQVCKGLKKPKLMNGWFELKIFTLSGENYVYKSLNKIKLQSPNHNIKLIPMKHHFYNWLKHHCFSVQNVY